MTEPSDRTETALLVIDVQNDVVANAHDRDGVVANIAALVDQARGADVPVVWVQHADEELVPDTEGWAYVPELAQHDSEPVVHKEHGDSFEGTTLEHELEQLGVGRLIVAGAQTDACIRSTLHGAFARGYDTFLVGDAHTTDDRGHPDLPTAPQVIAHTNLYWKYQSAPDRRAGVVATTEVTFAD